MSYCDQCARLLRDKEALTARVKELEGALKDLVRLVDEDQEEDAPPYLVDQVLDRARAAITKGESNG